jgi:hypothetical protein
MSSKIRYLISTEKVVRKVIETELSLGILKEDEALEELENSKGHAKYLGVELNRQLLWPWGEAEWIRVHKSKLRLRYGDITGDITWKPHHRYPSGFEFTLVLKFRSEVMHREKFNCSYDCMDFADRVAIDSGWYTLNPNLSVFQNEDGEEVYLLKDPEKLLPAQVAKIVTDMQVAHPEYTFVLWARTADGQLKRAVDTTTDISVAQLGAEEMGTFVASIIRNQPCMEFSLSFQNASGEAESRRPR